MPNAIKKGKAGEVEFCKWLKENLGIITERNYNQSQGGADVITDSFLFEVKRREAIDLDSWWCQVSIANKDKHKGELIPVVAFRQNRKSWQFLIPANLISGVERGYLICKESVFIEFAKSILGVTKIKALTNEFVEIYDEFRLMFDEDSCYCASMTMPPCTTCAHPGNPDALRDIEDAWEWKLVKNPDEHLKWGDI